VEIERNDQEFLDFLSEVVNLLDGPMPDLQADTCDWCKYHSRKSNIIPQHINTIKKTIPRCPQCDSDMVLKKGKFGEFWSCTKFPDCKGTRNV
jgi:DNA topoisomerase-1